MVKSKFAASPISPTRKRRWSSARICSGFNFYPPSPRCIAPDKAREIIARLPRDSFNVALFVNEPKRGSAKSSAAATLPMAGQRIVACSFTARRARDYCRGWDMKVIKAFRLKEKHSLPAMNDFPADFYLLDSWSAGYGGSGTGVSLGVARRHRRRPSLFFRADCASTMSPQRSGEFGRSVSTFAAAWKRAQVLKIMANSKNLSLLPKVPDRRGHFGPYGGRYVAETLMPALTELERAYAQGAARSPFQARVCRFICTNMPAGKRRSISPSG